MQLALVGFRRGPFFGSRSESPRSSGLEAVMARLGRSVPPFPVRFASTAAAAAPPFQPSDILVKVGDGGMYRDWMVKWDELKNMRPGGLLEKLARSETFGPDLKDVKLGGCSVGVIGALSKPDVLIEAFKATEVGDLTTVLDATMAGKCTGERLFIHVRLPGAEPMGLYGELC